MSKAETAVGGRGRNNPTEPGSPPTTQGGLPAPACLRQEGDSCLGGPFSLFSCSRCPRQQVKRQERGGRRIGRCAQDWAECRLRAGHRSCQTRGRPPTLDLALPAAPRGPTVPLACSGRSPALGLGRPAEYAVRARARVPQSSPRGSAARFGTLPPFPGSARAAPRLLLRSAWRLRWVLEWGSPRPGRPGLPGRGERPVSAGSNGASTWAETCRWAFASPGTPNNLQGKESPAAFLALRLDSVVHSAQSALPFLRSVLNASLLSRIFFATCAFLTLPASFSSH